VAYSNSRLKVLVQQVIDNEGDTVSFEYKWANDGVLIYESDDPTLKNVQLKKGDKITVTIIPFDGKIKGNPFITKPKFILNTPPVIKNAKIVPVPADTNTNLSVEVEAYDFDDDSITYKYQWLKNGVEIPDATFETLDCTYFSKDDIISVKITPEDEENEGKAFTTKGVIISNSPPIIDSTPPTFTVKGESMVYTYQVKAHDPDNDPITFLLGKGMPPGMEIDPDTGLLTWEITKKNSGTYPVEIIVRDNSLGKCSQKYTLTINYTKE